MAAGNWKKCKYVEAVFNRFAQKYRAMLVVALLGFVPIAFADLSIKDAIIEDCPSALNKLETLNEDSQPEIINYSTLVLSLKSVPEAGLSQMQPPMLPNPQHDKPYDMWNTELWKTLQSEKYVEAKKCALKILEKFAPKSFVVVPDILKFATAPATSAELSKIASETAKQIAKIAGADVSYVIDEDTYNKLLEYAFVAEAASSRLNELSAKGVFLEVGNKVIPFLVTTVLSTTKYHYKEGIVLLQAEAFDKTLEREQILTHVTAFDDVKRIRAVELLSAIGETGNALSYVIPLLNSNNEKVAVAALQAIVQWQKSAKPEEHQQVVKILVKEVWPKVARQKKVSRKLLLSGVQSFELLFTDPKNTFQQQLITDYRSLVKQNKLKKISAEEKADNQALQEDIVRLLARETLEGKSAFPKLLEGTVNIFIETLQSDNLELQSLAIKGLSNVREKTKVFSAYAKMLKSVKDKNSGLYLELVMQVSEAIQKLKVDKSANLLIPYLVDALKYNVKGTDTACTEEQIKIAPVMALIDFGKPAIKPVQKLIKKERKQNVCGEEELISARAEYVERHLK